MKFGLIGGGMISQIMHLPYLAEIPDVELEAIADPGSNVLEVLGDRYNIPHRYESSIALIDELSDELDALVIATPMQTHAEIATAALEANLHTFMEKPLAVDPEDAEEIIATSKQTDAVCVVGYMKRYDPGYQRFKQEVDSLDEIDLITGVIIPPNIHSVINETYDLVQPELSEEFIEESNLKLQTQAEQAIDSEDGELARTYWGQLTSICHDINALRGVFGSVEQIDFVDLFREKKYLTAQLRYEGGHRCILESGLTDRKWYDERIRVDAPDKSVEIEFSHAFLKNRPANVLVKETLSRNEKAEIEKTQSNPSFNEAFKKELVHFIDCINGEAEPHTPPEEAKKDIELLVDIFNSIQE